MKKQYHQTGGALIRSNPILERKTAAFRSAGIIQHKFIIISVIENIVSIIIFMRKFPQ